MNFHDYVNRQKTEDRRAFIIHYPAKSGKTCFARRAAETRRDVHLLDLQEYFVSQPGLPPVRKWDFKALRSLLLSLDVPQSVVIVDNPDFLFNTWCTEEKRTLLNWVGVGLRSPAETEKTFVFIVQNDDVISAGTFINTYGEPRVLAMNEFESV
jgi:hypothetical protein